jgi:hypothetical protein
VANRPAGPAGPAQPEPFDGRFIGASQSRLVEVQLAQTGPSVLGRMDWAGSAYELQFEATGGFGRGLIIDRQRDQQHATTAELDGGRLTFRVQLANGAVQVIEVARER